MDPVAEIKSRLPIEDLVRQYCALTKKGRNFVALCPFHNDTRPSMLVSPDKGIAYCFPCQKGGDVFSFYQLVEGVDFVQALKDLAERTGVQLPDDRVPVQRKDEKERARACLEAAVSLYRKALKANASVLDYLRGRGVTDAEIDAFEIGYAPDSFTHTYESLLKEGFSRTELTAAGMAIAKELGEDRMYDRFRHRLMFPIRDAQNRLVGFGGRTMGNDDAKYMNSSDGILFKKSELLFGLPQAKEPMREAKRAIIVEGYFDVLACHRIGVKHAVAACGTALTEQHAKLLKRYVDAVTLCLDQDRAGREAAERAFTILSKEGLAVYGVRLSEKDPADAVLTDADGLKALLTGDGTPYIDLALAEMGAAGLSDPKIRREALHRLLGLLSAVDSSVERMHYVSKAASAFGVTATAFENDLAAHHRVEAVRAAPKRETSNGADLFSAAELVIGLILLYPQCRELLKEMLPPADGMAAALYAAILASNDPKLAIDTLELPAEHRERAKVLHLYCEQHGMAEWTDSVALREIRGNCQNANREAARRKQQEIARRMLEARKAGLNDEEARLNGEFNELLRLGKTPG
jgi:DNA primase